MTTANDIECMEALLGTWPSPAPQVASKAEPARDAPTHFELALQGQMRLDFPATAIERHDNHREELLIMPTVVFIDTEFTDFAGSQLLSLGMVTCDGREFYAELDRDDCQSAGTFVQASDFVRHEGVLSQCGRVPGAAMSREVLAARAAIQLLDWARQADGPVVVAYDFPTDFLLLMGLLVSAGQWPTLNALLQPLNVAHVSDTTVGASAAETALVELKASRNIGVHHALADAHALRKAFMAVAQSVKERR